MKVEDKRRGGWRKGRQIVGWNREWVGEHEGWGSTWRWCNKKERMVPKTEDVWMIERREERRNLNETVSGDMYRREAGAKEGVKCVNDYTIQQVKRDVTVKVISHSDARGERERKEGWGFLLQQSLATEENHIFTLR
ncbi:unnamed protein product [Pleuronectes platessa]|uniref:Uncharacterized protein n=1 Tax=Pleuronectes platessa TaxID=8262 RepID=A0A9N7YY39_PLEPL|nr:unnamed protein product [Pleuronectes platessa]